MKITIHLHDGRQCDAEQPYNDAEHVVVAGVRCECSDDRNLLACGNGRRRVADEHGEAEDAACFRCGGSIGRIVVKLSTLFGRTEDTAVLCGRPRVY